MATVSKLFEDISVFQVKIPKFLQGSTEQWKKSFRVYLQKFTASETFKSAWMIKCPSNKSETLLRAKYTFGGNLFASHHRAHCKPRTTGMWISLTLFSGRKLLAETLAIKFFSKWVHPKGFVPFVVPQIFRFLPCRIDLLSTINFYPLKWQKFRLKIFSWGKILCKHEEDSFAPSFRQMAAHQVQHPRLAYRENETERRKKTHQRLFIQMPPGQPLLSRMEHNDSHYNW